VHRFAITRNYIPAHMAPQGPGYESELKCRAGPELNADSCMHATKNRRTRKFQGAQDAGEYVPGRSKLKAHRFNSLRTCCGQSHFYFRPRFFTRVFVLSQSTLDSHRIGIVIGVKQKLCPPIVLQVNN